jgi:hypothetical protein
MNSKALMAIFIAGIMISSTLGFILTSSSQTGGNSERTEFNGLSFVQTNQGWLTYLTEEDQVLISSDPRLLNNIQTPKVSINEINSGNRIYFTFNPEENIQHTFGYFDANIRPRLKTLTIGCTEDVPSCANSPLITCENALPQTKVIQVSLANQSSITYENDCLLIQGNSLQLQTFLDAIILELLHS